MSTRTEPGTMSDPNTTSEPRLREVRTYPRDRADKAAALGVGGRKEWVQWVDRVSDEHNISRGELIGIAMARLAESLGWELPPPRL